MAQSITTGRRSGATLLLDERGLSTIEYVVILVVVAAVALGTWSLLGHRMACALGIANDTVVAAGIGETSVAAQACSKGTPSTGGGHKEPATDEVKHKHP